MLWDCQPIFFPLSLSLSLSLSVHSIEMQVDYFEKEGGILTKVLETVVSAKDVPLSQTFQEDKYLAEVYKQLKCE